MNGGQYTDLKDVQDEYKQSNVEYVKAVFLAIFSLVNTERTIEYIIDKYKHLMDGKYKHLMDGLEEACCETETIHIYGPLFPDVLSILYKFEMITKEDIMTWLNKMKKKLKTTFEQSLYEKTQIIFGNFV